MRGAIASLISYVKLYKNAVIMVENIVSILSS
jgi:hypothetical protein